MLEDSDSRKLPWQSCKSATAQFDWSICKPQHCSSLFKRCKIERSTFCSVSYYPSLGFHCTPLHITAISFSLARWCRSTSSAMFTKLYPYLSKSLYIRGKKSPKQVLCSSLFALCWGLCFFGIHYCVFYSFCNYLTPVAVEEPDIAIKEVSPAQRISARTEDNRLDIFRKEVPNKN